MDQIDQTDSPPTMADPLDLLPEPPKWPKVIGIISISWASLGLVCTGCGAVMIPLQGGMIKASLNGAPVPPSMSPGLMDYVLLAIGAGLALVLLTAGIMTASRSPNGRPMHLLYAVGSLPVLALNIWNMLQKQAAMAQWANDYPDNPIAKSQQGAGGTVGLIIGFVMLVVFGLAWPTFCLFWFGLYKRRSSDIAVGVGNPAA